MCGITKGPKFIGLSVCACVMCLALVSTVRYIPTSRHRSSRVSGQARLPKPKAYLQLVLLLLDVPHTGYLSDTHGRLSDLIDANPRFVRPELCYTSTTLLKLPNISISTYFPMPGVAKEAVVVSSIALIYPFSSSWQ